MLSTHEDALADRLEQKETALLDTRAEEEDRALIPTPVAPWSAYYDDATRFANDTVSHVLKLGREVHDAQWVSVWVDFMKRECPNLTEDENDWLAREGWMFAASNTRHPMFDGFDESRFRQRVSRAMGNYPYPLEPKKPSGRDMRSLQYWGVGKAIYLHHPAFSSARMNQSVTSVVYLPARVSAELAKSLQAMGEASRAGSNLVPLYHMLNTQAEVLSKLDPTVGFVEPVASPVDALFATPRVIVRIRVSLLAISSTLSEKTPVRIVTGMLLAQARFILLKMTTAARFRHGDGAVTATGATSEGSMLHVLAAAVTPSVSAAAAAAVSPPMGRTNEQQSETRWEADENETESDEDAPAASTAPISFRVRGMEEQSETDSEDDDMMPALIPRRAY